MDDLTRDGIVRGLIIEAAKMESPAAISDRSLLAMLQAGGHETQSIFALRRNLEYLAGLGKEYLAIDKRNPHIWLIKILSKGVDLADGRIEDPAGGVIIRRG